MKTRILWGILWSFLLGFVNAVILWHVYALCSIYKSCSSGNLMSVIVIRSKCTSSITFYAGLWFRYYANLTAAWMFIERTKPSLSKELNNCEVGCLELHTHTFISFGLQVISSLKVNNLILLVFFSINISSLPLSVGTIVLKKYTITCFTAGIAMKKISVIYSAINIGNNRTTYWLFLFTPPPPTHTRTFTRARTHTLEMCQWKSSGAK